MFKVISKIIWNFKIEFVDHLELNHQVLQKRKQM